jgi:hypothetical protein
MARTQPGQGVDSEGRAVVDPTENVLSLVEAAIRRQDDLRAAEALRLEQLVVNHQNHTAELRRTETARLDAIRAVDVGAVNRAAEVAAQQASTLAAQVAQSAETLRTQVAAAAVSARVELTAALEPIQKDIADLRRAQYEAQGKTTQGTEQRLNIGAILGGVSVLMVLVFGVVSIVLATR